MVQLFNLTVPDDRKRADIDAHLLIDGKLHNFELKSTTSKTVSTVRDFGPDHIAKWRNDLHWIFAFYEKDGVKLKYCVYASPADMEPWIAARENYIAPDLALAEALPMHVAAAQVIDVLGEKPVYSRADARRIMKNQWRAADYEAGQDLKDGYSLERMTVIMQQRARYVLLRGSTLNNPHIESDYFDGFEKITSEHAAKLRELIRAYLKTSATDAATA